MSDLYIFNPTSEMAIANGNASYMPPKNLRKFEHDLSFLPSFFAKQNDTVVCKEPDHEFLNMWQQLGVANNIEFANLKDINHPLNELMPWSWNPAIHGKLKEVKQYCSSNFINGVNANWNSECKELFSRKSCMEVQKHICKHNTISIIEIPKYATKITSLQQAIDFVACNNEAVFKVPLSSSGRGLHFVSAKNGKQLNTEWIQGAIKQQGYLSAEPLLDKLKDFSFQLDLKPNGEINFLGISHFINDSKGHFIGGDLNKDHSKEDYAEFFSNDFTKNAASVVINAIKSLDAHKWYYGKLGVDAIIYRTNDGKLRMHPALDINWRYNMGNLNILIPNFINPTSCGKWYINSFRQEGEYSNFINEHKKSIVLRDNKIVSGIVPLTPPTTDAQFGAYIQIEES